MAKKLTPETLTTLLEMTEEVAIQLRDAAKRWDLLNPPEGLEQAALTLLGLSEATNELLRPILSTVANQAYAKGLETQLRAQLKEGTQ